MQVLSPNSAVLEKTRELCELILQSSEYTHNVARIDAFFKNEAAQQSYREFAQLGEALHSKQQEGKLGPDDISLYDKKLEELKSDPTTANFMEAEETLNAMVHQISKHVGKTLELGRLPDPEDLKESECCSSGGCGC